MAANLQSRGIASLGRRFASKIRTSNASSLPDPTQLLAPSSATAPVFGRGYASASSYDKNVDEQVRPVQVPDDVIQRGSEEYWAPHPQTGVFGPAAGQNSTAVPGGAAGSHFRASNGGAEGSSVLEHQAWFRPNEVEDLEKPSHH